MFYDLGYVREGKDSCFHFMNPFEANADSGQTATHRHSMGPFEPHRNIVCMYFL